MRMIEYLRLTDSNNIKQEILGRANVLEKIVFSYAYGPFTFGINQLGEENHDLGEPSWDMFQLLDQLANRELTGNAALEAVKSFMDEHGSLIALICKKDLNCGISVTTLNKVFGKDFIPTHKVQLADTVPLEKVKLPVAVETKYDGVRITAIIDSNSKTIFKTRNGKVIQFPDLYHYFIYHGVKDIILDGELVIDDGLSINRTSVSGLVNSAIHGTPITNKDIRFKVFDTLSVKEFNNQQCNYSFEHRRQKLENLVKMFDNDKDVPNTVIQISNITRCYTVEEINNLFEEKVKNGFEGLILKGLNSLYTFKRSKDWVKIKEEKDVTLTCVDWLHGESGTKYNNAIGKLCLVGEAEGKQITVNVGTGLSDAERFVENPTDVYVGKKIDVKYNSVIQDSKSGKWSLFLARFICIREDLQ